eukprot:1076672-Prorocentrum_minimum.AAC.1
MRLATTTKSTIQLVRRRVGRLASAMLRDVAYTSEGCGCMQSNTSRRDAVCLIAAEIMYAHDDFLLLRSA